MTLYLEAEVVKEAGGMLLADNDAAESMHDNIQEGKTKFRIAKASGRERTRESF